MSNRIRVTASTTACSPMIQPTRSPVARVLLKVPMSTAPVPPATVNSDGSGSRSKLMPPYASSWAIMMLCSRQMRATACRRSIVIVPAAGF